MWLKKTYEVFFHILFTVVKWVDGDNDEKKIVVHGIEET